MTFQSNDGSEDDDAKPYAVGYRKPPAEHRFKKGRSGNPAGRPKKVSQRKAPNGLSFGAQPANAYLLEEAYRPVLVREGEHTIELPAIQAVFRAMGVAAMKGNRFAQRTMAELVQSVETEDRKLRLEHLETMINYKCEWDRAIERAREFGQPEPQPIPHPDDVIINFKTGDAVICGPMTKEDKVEWNKLLEHVDNLQEEISMFASEYAKARKPENKARMLDMWKFEQNLFDRLNDNLPKRYQRQLRDRCWKEGASRPGRQRKAKWPDGV